MTSNRSARMCLSSLLAFGTCAARRNGKGLRRTGMGFPDITAATRDASGTNRWGSLPKPAPNTAPVRRPEPAELAQEASVTSVPASPHGTMERGSPSPVIDSGRKVSGAGSTCWPGTSRGFQNSNPKTRRVAGRVLSLSSWSNAIRTQEPCGHRGKPRCHARERWRR